jgi:hypothetical protein
MTYLKDSESVIQPKHWSPTFIKNYSSVATPSGEEKNKRKLEKPWYFQIIYRENIPISYKCKNGWSTNGTVHLYAYLCLTMNIKFHAFRCWNAMNTTRKNFYLGIFSFSKAGAWWCSSGGGGHGAHPMAHGMAGHLVMAMQ